MKPLVTIAILNWNGASLLPQFLPSVVAFSPASLARIVVYDNGSTDNSLSILAEQFPQVTTISFTENLGYAGGYNAALDSIETPYICLLNSDVAVTEGWLEEPLRMLQSHEEIAALQPKILSHKDPSQFEYAGAAGGLLDRWGYPYCRGRILDTLEQDHGQYDQPTELHWASGAALFVRRSDFIAVGGFETAFFAHMEEIDLCWRLRNRGKHIAIAPHSTVYHLGGGTLDNQSPQKLYLNFRNNLLMLHKNLPPALRRRVLAMRALLDILAWGVYLLKGQRTYAGAVLRARRDYHRMAKSFVSAGSRALAHPLAPYSTLWQYHMRGRKRFSELPPLTLSSFSD